MRRILIVVLCCCLYGPSHAQTIFERSRNSILHIIVDARYTDGKTERLSEGTGFLVKSNGYVLTASHLVDFEIKNADIEIRGSFLLRDATKHMLYVIDKWKHRDFALLTMSPNVKELSETEPLPIGDSDLVKEQDRLMTIGFPIGGEIQTTSGELTGRAADKGLWVTSLLVAQGYSGAPVLNTVGSVVGIMLAGTGAPGINVFRPINHVKAELIGLGIAFPQEELLTGTDSPIVSSILTGIRSRGESGAIALATRLRVKDEYMLAQSMLFAESIQIDSGAFIKLAEDAVVKGEVILLAERIEVTGGEEPAYIVWEGGIDRASSGASYNGSAAAGQNGSSDGESGAPGADGAPGGPGEDGRRAPDLILITREIIGPGLVVDLSGQPGGIGGGGQDGGPGGHGARGRPASQSAFDCKRGPGRGGDGGPGGNGGHGGPGGDGGDGGNLTIISLDSYGPPASNLINGLAAGGAEGYGGPGGIGGHGGRGGPEGALALPYCRSAGRDGSPGTKGKEGREGESGARGTAGEVRQIILTPEEFRRVATLR